MNGASEADEALVKIKADIVMEAIEAARKVRGKSKGAGVGKGGGGVRHKKKSRTMIIALRVWELVHTCPVVLQLCRVLPEPFTTLNSCGYDPYKLTQPRKYICWHAR